MKTEIEAKFLSVDLDEVRAKLTQLGAKCVKPMRLMRRVTIDGVDMKAKDAFLRVRDEGDKVTLAYKQFDEASVSGTKEIEVEVENFEDTVHILEQSGLPHGSFQESKRENWELNGVEIMLDEWPWLDPYVEIEADEEGKVKDLAAKLGFNWQDAVFGDVMAAYRVQYPHLKETDTVGNIAEVKFDQPLPDLFKP
jgi:adenylate cyclase class 2